MIDQNKMNGSSLASTSNNKTKQPVKNSDNIYDIICYYDDNNDEESVGNVNDVINKIEKANNGKRNHNTSRYSDKSYLHWKLFGCLIINVRTVVIIRKMNNPSRLLSKSLNLIFYLRFSYHHQSMHMVQFI